jgi:HEAT repeat protein
MQPQTSIRDRLARNQPEVRAAALAELLRSEADPSPYVEELGGCIQDPSQSVRLMTLVLLGRIGDPAVQYLDAALAMGEPDSFRAATAAVIAGIGPPAAACTRNLCRCLTSAGEALRNAASAALAKIGEPAVPALRRMLRFPNPETVIAALQSLAMIGPPAAAAVSDVDALASRPFPPLRLACAATLACLTGDPARGLPVLLQALGDSDAQVRRTAAEKIGGLGRVAHPAIPDLVRHAADADESVRAAAVLALGRIRAPHAQVGPAVAARLGDPAADVRYAAVVVLSGLGAEARSSLAPLRALLQDPEERVANCAAAAVRWIEKADSPQGAPD